MENQPRKIFLTLILIGTTILAIPSAIGLFYLYKETSGLELKTEDSAWLLLLLIPLAGFLLYAGYILTAVFRRHSSIFWCLSMVYNFLLSCAYWLAMTNGFGGSPGQFLSSLHESPILLLPVWTSFVTYASGYYCFYPFSDKRSKYI